LPAQPAVCGEISAGRYPDDRFSDFRNCEQGCNFFASCWLDVPKSRGLRSMGAIGRRPNLTGQILSSARQAPIARGAGRSQ
jgi:hypothetical protein